MLGRLRRTTRVDVGLALTFAGFAYLAWALVAGSSRHLVQEMIKSAAYHHMTIPKFTHGVKVFFVDTGFVIDLVGLAWLAIALVLVLLSSRQRISVSWAWVAAICQAFTAAGGAALVGWAVYAPNVVPTKTIETSQTPFEIVSEISLPVIIAVAVLLWVVCLVWLLVERARLDRRGPTLRDGLRTNIYR